MKNFGKNRSKLRQIISGSAFMVLLVLVAGFYKPSQTSSAETPSSCEQTQSVAAPPINSSRPLPHPGLNPPLNPAPTPPTRTPPQVSRSLPTAAVTEAAAIASSDSASALSQPVFSAAPGWDQRVLQSALTQLRASGEMAPTPISDNVSAPDATSSQSPAPGSSTPNPAPDPGTSDISWRLLAQLSVHDTNAAVALVANHTEISDAAWDAIGATLVSESLQDGILRGISDPNRGVLSEEDLHRRLDVIESLLAVAPESGRKSLHDALVWLSQRVTK